MTATLPPPISLDIPKTDPYTSSQALLAISYDAWLNGQKIKDGGGDVLEFEDDGSLPVTIKSPLESNGAIPVNIQDQHSLALDLRFIRAQGAPTTLAVNGAIEDTELISSVSISNRALI